MTFYIEDRDVDVLIKFLEKKIKRAIKQWVESEKTESFSNVHDANTNWRMNLSDEMRMFAIMYTDMTGNKIYTFFENYIEL